jgi:sugar phosphate isomerase/epimerase
MPDYAHYIQQMDIIGYNGYFTFELCHPLYNKNHEQEGIGFVDEQVSLAREFMANIINQ